MTIKTHPEEVFSTGENFAELLDNQPGISGTGFEGKVLPGTIISIGDDHAIIDVGLKSEGRVPLKEFGGPGQAADLDIGETVDVFVERYEDRDGLIRLSREKARREEAWVELEKSFTSGSQVNGVMFGRVKGGFIVDLAGAVAFLPGSQVDIRPVRDVAPLMGVPQAFQILKMDQSRNNIVVSRRAVLEETRTAERSELISNLKEGQTLEGVVKNITDYGAFVDLGGVDGLLHVTDIAWKRINHPSEAIQMGDTIKVQVIRFNSENQRISLSMKQLEADPWESVESKFALGTKCTGRVTNITDYGAFVELEAGVEGLVHVSEMSWTKKNVHPGKIVSTSQEVEVVVLDTDLAKRRISLGLKQCVPNPWESFVEIFPLNSEVEGEIKNITEFGLFIGLDGEIDGMAHLSDLAWDQSGEEVLNKFKKGDVVKAKVLDVDIEKERISLGIKQLSADPMVEGFSGLKKGLIVTCEIAKVVDGGIEVLVNDAVPGFIRKSDLSRERSEQRPDRFAPGEKVDAKITQVDKTGKKLTLSIKAREIEEEKKAMDEYGSTDSGASLGDILGAALQEKKKEQTDDVEQEKSIKTAQKTSTKKQGKKDAESSDESAENQSLTGDAAGDEKVKKTKKPKKETKKE